MEKSFDAAALFNKAHDAGLKAVEALEVRPMVVVGGGKQYFVPDGVCGFAWVKVRPARGKFVDYLKARNLGHKAYDGGYDYWVSMFNQSMQKKEAYASAFAAVLRDNGLNAYAGSRMD